jgi:hypothetical protein
LAIDNLSAPEIGLPKNKEKWLTKNRKYPANDKFFEKNN